MQNVLTILAILTWPQIFIAPRFFTDDVRFFKFEMQIFAASAVGFSICLLLHVTDLIHSNFAMAMSFCLGSVLLVMGFDFLLQRELARRAQTERS